YRCDLAGLPASVRRRGPLPVRYLHRGRCHVCAGSLALPHLCTVPCCLQRRRHRLPVRGNGVRTPGSARMGGRRRGQTPGSPIAVVLQCISATCVLINTLLTAVLLTLVNPRISGTMRAGSNNGWSRRQGRSRRGVQKDPVADGSRVLPDAGGVLEVGA